MSREVKLHVYDLSNGLARQLSSSLLGKQIDGIWHTGVVVDGIEYFFGQGIQHCPAHASPFGAPLQVINLGTTEITNDLLQDFLADVRSRFNAQTYDLLSNNCNNFSEELAQFLVGKSIPAHITGLPAEVASTPFGRMIMPMLQPALQQRLSSATSTGFAAGSDQTSASIAAAVDSATHTHTAENLLSGKQPSGPGPSAQASAPQGGADIKGGGAAEGVKTAFKAALHDEFHKVQAEGEKDPNKAGSEALRRVMVAVRDGLVERPDGTAAA